MPLVLGLAPPDARAVVGAFGITALKLGAFSVATALTRVAFSSFSSAGDYPVFTGKPATAAKYTPESPHPLLPVLNAAHRNEIESAVPFGLALSAAIAAGVGSGGHELKWYCWTYVGMRALQTASHLYLGQPLRAISFFGGILVPIGLSGRALLVLARS